VNPVRGSDPIDGIDDSVIFPSEPGNKVIFLGKEALLARLSDLRGEPREEIVDRFFYLSREQGYYFTDAFVIAEFLSTVRYGTSAERAEEVRDDLLSSAIRVRYGNDDWEETELESSPKEVLLIATELFSERDWIDFSVQEATLVLAGVDADYIFSFDTAVRELARSLGVEVLPYTDAIW
jgi:hypothetical protein